MKILLAIALLALGFPPHLPAQPATDTALQPLTADQRAALQQIDQRDVTAAISFLASDELQGRGTATPGLETAGAYVASRFRAAGLDGPGDDADSFYQSETLAMIRTPSQGVVLEDADGRAMDHFGLYAAGDQALEFIGEVAKVDAEREDQQFDGPVVMPLDTGMSGLRLRLNVANRVRSLRQQGATAVLLRVAQDHPLVDMAAANRAQVRLPSRRVDSQIPVLLVPDDDNWPVPQRLELPAREEPVQVVNNVIGILHGSDVELSQQAIIFSAHLDHLGSRKNASDDSIYNGADDNASGVTGVLELADAFAALPTAPKRTMIFVAFWGEERGLLGSKFLVENPIWPLGKVVANINLEMIGRPEAGANGKAWMTGWEHSDLGELMRVGAERVDVDVFEHPQFSNRLYRASDNWPFVQAGVIAHSFSAGSLHNDYHQPTDEWEKLDLRHMTIVIRGLFAGSLPIADGQLTPRKAGLDD